MDSAQAESLLYFLEQAAKGTGLYMNSDKIEFMHFNSDFAIFPLNGKPLKFVDKSNTLYAISHLPKGMSTFISQVWIAIDRLSIIWKSDLSDEIKWKFFQVIAISVLLFGCTTLLITKCTEKKFDGNDTRILHVVLIKSWKQHPPKQQLYSHLPPILQIIKER